MENMVVAPRANWKGNLTIDGVSSKVSLFTAASTSERIAFHTLNRKTGHRVRRQFIDTETGKPVEADDQVKGYETGQGDYIILEPEEITAAIPESDKTLAIQAFIPCSDIDEIYFDRPYYLAPSTPVDAEAFALLREGMRTKKVAGIALTVLFRRVRTVLLRPYGQGLVANTLNFDYEVVSAEDAFSPVPKIKIEGEMLDLARHIIKTKAGRFDPKSFDDRYEEALADLVRAKLEGRPVKPRAAPKPTKVVDLMEALRASAKAGSPSGTPKRESAAAKKRSPTPSTRRKAS